MTITAAGLKASTGYAVATSGTHSVGSVTAGQLVTVVVGAYSVPNQAFVSSDLTKSAGTCTIGTISLDKELDPANAAHVGIWSFLVTGSGTLTVQLSNRPAGAYFDIGAEAFNGSWDGSRLEASNSATVSASTNIDSGNATSAGAALMVGVFSDVTGASSYTTDGAWTDLYQDVGSPNNSGGAYRIVSSGATDSATWTANAGINGAAAIAIYKETAGGSPIGAIANHYSQLRK